jgi:DNA-binding NtrC family response regulator
MNPLHSGQCLLVVDDEPSVRRFLCAALRQAGFDVTEAADARQALALSPASAALCAMVTDFDIARNDGIGVNGAFGVTRAFNGVELAVQVRRAHPGLPILIISGSPDAEGVAVNRGFAFIAKPFTSTGLVAAVESICPPAFPMRPPTGFASGA